MDKKTKRIQRLSLEHWFVNHQLRAIKKDHFHLPGAFDVDVHELVKDIDDPCGTMTVIVIKALGLTLEAVPEANRVYMRTLFGERLVQPDYIGINVPIRVKHEGGVVTTAVTIDSPQLKTFAEIKNELRAAVAGGLKMHPVARFVVQRGNYFWNRLALKMLAFVAYHVPTLYLRFRAGGTSLSSLLYEGRDAVPLTTMSFGPTTFTVLMNSLWKENGRWTLRLGVGFDHYASAGDLAVIFAKRLAKVLNGEDRELYARLKGSSTKGQTQCEPGPLLPADHEL
jgi:hypothetical protein